MRPREAFDLDVTVLTPTYNRRDLLPRVYESLARQTSRRFEWLVVDDGSSDDTGELVRAWAAEADFPIRYLRQDNAGKHVALNRGIEAARGFFVGVLDSDDWYAPDAIERAVQHWEAIPEALRPGFWEVVGLFAYESGAIVGTAFPHHPLDTDAIEIRVRHRVQGDKLSFSRADVLRRFPFPEDQGRFVIEGIIWNRIALEYRARFVNDVFGYKEYQPGGLSDRGLALRVASSQVTRAYYQEFVSNGRQLPPDLAMRNYANYVRFSLHEGLGPRRMATDVPSGLWLSLSAPLGWALYGRDRLALRRAARS